jgi:hypothetical protein
VKLFKLVLVLVVLLVNFAIAQPSWADRPKLTGTPEYTEVTEALDALFKAKDAPDDSGYSPEAIQQKIGELQLQKYILETATEWSQCSNQTGRTLAVYAHKAKKAQEGTLYYLGNGQATDDDWNCDGILLPTGAKVAGLTSADAPELSEPLAFKIVSGTQLVAKTNPDTNAIEFNIAPAKVLKAGEGTWAIPNLAQADVDAQTPNAPIED